MQIRSTHIVLIPEKSHPFTGVTSAHYCKVYLCTKELEYGVEIDYFLEKQNGKIEKITEVEFHNLTK